MQTSLTAPKNNIAQLNELPDYRLQISTSILNT